MISESSVPYRSPRANVGEIVWYYSKGFKEDRPCPAMVCESDGNGGLGLLVFLPGNIQGTYRRGVRHHDNPFTPVDAKRVVGSWEHAVKATQPSDTEYKAEVAKIEALKKETEKEEIKARDVHKWWSPQIEKDIVDYRHEGLSPGEIGQLVWGPDVTKQQGLWRTRLVLEKYGLSPKQLRDAAESGSVSATEEKLLKTAES